LKDNIFGLIGGYAGREGSGWYGLHYDNNSAIVDEGD